MHKTKIAAVVVLYKPILQLTIDNIRTYINKVDCLQVIDNTEIINPQIKEVLLREFGSKINYISFNENLGIAKALNIGISSIKETDIQWVLTMDQDSFFESHTYFNTFELLDKEGVAIFAPEPVTELPTKKKEVLIEKVDAVITSGNLLLIKAWKTVSGFREEFFIDDVDTEFCFKCIGAGFDIFIIRGTYINHFIGTITKRRYFFTKKALELHSPLRLYYIVRNGSYLKQEYQKLFPQHIAICQKVIKKRIKHNVIGGGKPLEYIYYICLAKWHYFTNKMGKLDVK